jgi:hypothetical protein
VISPSCAGLLTRQTLSIGGMNAFSSQSLGRPTMDDHPIHFALSLSWNGPER